MTATTILRITARRPAGFRRAGLFHPAAPVDHAIDSFTSEQIAALTAEPQLLVERVELQTPDTSQPPVGEVPAGESSPAGQAQAEAALPQVATAAPTPAVAPTAGPKVDAKKAPAAAPKKGK